MRTHNKIIMLISLFIFVLFAALYSQQSSWQVGDTTSFWAYDFGFFQKYYKVNAMLRAIGDHCYIFSQEDTLSIHAVEANIPLAIFRYTFVSFPIRDEVRTLYRTSDLGTTWQGTGSNFPYGITVTSLTFHPTSAVMGILLAGFKGGGVYSTMNAGGSWIAKNDSLTDLRINAVAVSPDTMSTTYRMYAGSKSGVFWRENFGSDTIWKKLPNTGLADTNVICMSSTNDMGTIYIGTLSGIFKWSGMDSSWLELNAGLTNTDIRFVKVDRYAENILYTGTPDGLYKSINSGSTWVSIFDKSALSLDMLPDSLSTLYLGTNGDGIYKSIDGGAQWTEINNGLTTGGPATLVYVVQSIGIYAPDTVIAGTSHGVFLTTDGGNNWLEINKGLIKGYVSEETADSVKAVFESTIPSDSARGMFDVCTVDFGDPPDTDADPHIFIFLLAAQGVTSYFDEINEFDTVYSNKCEMLYLDSGNPTSTAKIGALAKSFQEMIHWNYDRDEKQWIVKGLSMLAKHFVLVGESNTDSSTTYFFPMNNDFTYWGDASDEDMCGLWSMYLYENYGGISMLHNLISDTLSGFDGVDNTVQEEGFSETHVDIFKDWVIASYVNNPDTTFHNGKYGYNLIRNINFSDNTITDSTPYEEQTTFWSVNNIYLKYGSGGIPPLGDSLLFNGNTSNNISLFYIKLDSMETTLSVEEVQLTDTEARTYIGDLNATYTTLVPMVIVTGEEGSSPVQYVFHNDLIAPDYVQYSFFQDPLQSSYLNFYLFASDRIFRDVGDETPLLEFTQNTNTDTVVMSVFLEQNSDSITVIYKGDYHISGSGTATITASGEDLAGNNIEPLGTSIAIQHIPSENGGLMVSVDGTMSLDIPSCALSKDTYFTIFTLSSTNNPDNPRAVSFGNLVVKPEERETKGFAYRVGPTGIMLKKPATLSMHYDGDQTNNEVGIYRLESNGWHYVGGIINKQSQTISVRILKIGTYQIQVGPHTSLPEVPTVFCISQNFPNPMNSTTTIQYQLPCEIPVSIKIYNVAGREVRTLVNGMQTPGYKNIQWNGTDNNGTKLSAGVYFYRMQTSEFVKVQRLVILK